jgi:hypothetical protein
MKKATPSANCCGNSMRPFMKRAERRHIRFIGSLFRL